MPNQKVGMFIDNPETFSDTALYRGGELGMVYNAPGSTNHYQLVQIGATSDAAGVAKEVCYWLDPAAFTVTMTIAESLSGTADAFAGIVMTAVPISSYGFIKFKGKHNVKVNGATKGKSAVPHTASNYLDDNTAALYVPVVGFFYGNAGANLADTFLMWKAV